MAQLPASVAEVEMKRTNSTTPGGLDLDTVRARAASATAAAGALRDRVASGDPTVNFAALEIGEAFVGLNARQGGEVHDGIT